MQVFRLDPSSHLHGLGTFLLTLSSKNDDAVFLRMIHNKDLFFVLNAYIACLF